MMKIKTWLLLLVSMMIPMTVGAQLVKKGILTDRELLKNNSSLLEKNVPAPADKRVLKPSGLIKGNGLRRAPKGAPSADAITWDFEEEQQFQQWMIVDNDGDGHNWEYFSNTSNVSGSMEAHSGEGLVCSASYDYDAGSPLTPDNWLISPEVTLGGVLSFWAWGQDGNDYEEVFGVFVYVGSNPTPDEFVQVGADKSATHEMTEYSYDLSKYAGQTGRFAIRHYKTTNMFYLNIDDVCLDINATYIPEPTSPTNLMVDPVATTANVTWDGAEGNAWNLRYKVNNPNETVTLLWDLTVDNYESQIEDWSFQDRDEDGNNWRLAYSDFGSTGELDDEDNVCFFSDSYSSSGQDILTPDNWLISPELKLGGTFKFWAKNDEYPDVLGVYVVTDKEEVQIGADFSPETKWTEYIFDTSEFEGQVGKIAIVHHNCTDKYHVYVDYISYYEKGDEPAEWIEVNELTDTQFTIKGLKPGADYMVEVMAYNERGETEWTSPTYFTTLDYLVLEDNADNSTVISDNVEYHGKVMLNERTLYKDGNWNTICLPFDVTLEGSVLEGAIAKPISNATMTGTHVDITFGDAVDALEAGMPYIIKWVVAEGETAEDIVNPMFEDVTLSSTEGRTISLADGHVKFIGYFNPMNITADDTSIYYLTADNKLACTSKDRTLKAFRAYFEFTANYASDTNSFSVSFNFGTDAITNVLNTVANGETWFTLDGRRLSGKPTQKGVYVTNGQKVIIK